MISGKGNIRFSENQAETHAPAIVGRGILINLPNSKLTPFFFSFLPQYISPDSANHMTGQPSPKILFMVLTFICSLDFWADPTRE